MLVASLLFIAVILVTYLVDGVKGILKRIKVRKLIESGGSAWIEIIPSKRRALDPESLKKFIESYGVECECLPVLSKKGTFYVYILVEDYWLFNTMADFDEILNWRWAFSYQTA
jgi:hypothetical protein